MRVCEDLSEMILKIQTMYLNPGASITITADGCKIVGIHNKFTTIIDNEKEESDD